MRGRTTIGGVLDTTRRAILHGAWIVPTAAVLGDAPAATAATTDDQTYVVPLPANMTGDHTAHIRDHMNIAKEQLAKRVILPYLNPEDPTARWNISDFITAWAGVELMFAPILATEWSKPIVYVPVGAPGVTVYFHDAQGIRVPHSTYPDPGTGPKRFGGGVIGSHSAVRAFASRTTIRGYIHHFRVAAAAGNWDETTGTNRGRPVGIDIDIEVHDVDFGIIFYAQKSGRFVARGNFLRSPGSPDEPHLIYGTHSTTSSRDCTVIVDCWAPLDQNGNLTYMEGVPLILKANENVHVPWVTCRGTNGMVEIIDEAGSTKIGTMIGAEIGTEGRRADGVAKLSGILLGGSSSGWTGAPHPKSVESLTVSLRADAASVPGNLRVATLNAGSWSIGSLDIEYELDELSSAQALITIMGGNTDIDRVRITNRGGGGVVGMRYRTPDSGPHSRHVLRTPPHMKGVSTAVLVDDEIADLNLNIDKSLITQATIVLDMKRTPSRTVVQGAIVPPTRINRYYAFPAASSFTSITLTQNVEYCYMILLHEPTRLTSLGIRVTTAASGGTIRLGVRNDLGNGTPGPLVAEIGSISASTVGDFEITAAEPVILSAGAYWLSIVAQGGNPQVHGAGAGAVISPATTLTRALSGAVIHQTGVTGNLPVGFTETSQSTVTGCARIAFRVQ